MKSWRTSYLTDLLALADPTLALADQRVGVDRGQLGASLSIQMAFLP